MFAARAVIVLVVVLGLALARRLYVQWRAGLHNELSASRTLQLLPYRAERCRHSVDAKGGLAPKRSK